MCNPRFRLPLGFFQEKRYLQGHGFRRQNSLSLPVCVVYGLTAESAL